MPSDGLRFFLLKGRSMMDTHQQGKDITDNDQKMVHSAPESIGSMVTSGNILCIIGLTTLVQALCFLIVSMLLDDVTVLPTDPLIIIGTMYAFMGITFMVVSCILQNWRKKKAVINIDTSLSSKSDDSNPSSNSNSNEVQFQNESDVDKTRIMIQSVDSQQLNGEGKLSNITELNTLKAGTMSDTEQTWQILDCNLRHRVKDDNSTAT